MKTSNTKSFIGCLDHYKNVKDLNYFEIMNLLNIINIHYVENKYSDPYYSGIDYNNNAIPMKIENIEKGGFYNLFSDSKWNQQNNYDIWKQKHEINISPNEQLLEPLEIPKPKVTIDASINNLDDLLSIIKNNVYDEKNDYNIDLKSLTKIQPELEKLNKMIGMKDLKNSMLNQLLYFMQDLHITNKESDFKHTVLYGPPGTGKTEIAKIIGTMYSKIGILKNNVFKKVTRNDLVAGYLGQTAIKTKKVIDECLGGVLFIDEAYSLANNYQEDGYSKECIDTLCEALSDHKDDLMVIIAGYEEDLNNSFFKANKGMESRFIWRFNIEQYNTHDLMEIFKKKINETDWVLEYDVVNIKWFDKRKQEFKNYGRDMELLFSYLKIAHSRRIYGKDASLRKHIILEDLDAGYDMFMKNKKKENKMNKILESIYI
jgi:SpoVK/Ycf46/Vps4 family AAA+-type ATPase